jgi:aspartyl-tRNA(Asn)/glutamyl-tRNA(Gln) amidotransferase subunit C
MLKISFSVRHFLSETFMKITKAEVEHVARLARLELTEAEQETFTGQMDAILAYVEKLNELDTSGIIPTAHAVPMENAFREDQVVPSFGVDNALANAPERVEGFFRVPKVIE